MSEQNGAPSTDDASQALANKLIGHVAEIEDSIETTRGHYGEYMNLISGVSQGDQRLARIVALGLIKAGANKRGVDDALRIVVGG